MKRRKKKEKRKRKRRKEEEEEEEGAGQRGGGKRRKKGWFFYPLQTATGSKELHFQGSLQRAAFRGLPLTDGAKGSLNDRRLPKHYRYPDSP